MSDDSDTAAFEVSPFVMAVKVGALLIVAAFVYVWRPLFHGIIYRVAYSPGALFFIGLPVLVAVILFLAPPIRGPEPESRFESRKNSLEAKAALVVTVAVIGLVLALFVGGAAAFYEDRDLATDTMQDADSVDQFPQANPDNPRIVPRAVADTQTRGSVSYRQYELGTSDIARMEDGRLAWSYAIQPDPIRVRIQGHQRGVLLSDMTSMEDREMRAYDDQSFAHGQAMWFHRSADWHLKKGSYWHQYRDDPIEFTHEGTAYMAFPKTGHEWRWAGPIPYTVPVWDGVALVHPDGTIEHMSPEEAQESEILDGQRLYPLYNAERRANSLKYRNGITNALPLVGSYEGVVEPATIPGGSGNSQPFVIDLEGEEMSYVMAMEPYGEDTRGLDEVWFFHAETGEMQYYESSRETLFGPERAMGIVRSQDSQTDWGSNFDVTEPIPTVVDDELWWHTKVVPTDNTDVTRNVFVNAHTGEAIAFTETQGVKEFISGENVEEIDDAQQVGTGEGGEDTADNETDGDVAYYIIIYDSEGNEVNRIPVREGEEARIEQEQRQTQTPTSG